MESKLVVHEAAAQGWANLTFNEFKDRACPSFGIIWQVSRNPITLILPEQTAIDRIRELDAKAVVPVLDKAFEKGAQETANAAEEKWPEPGEDIARYYSAIVAPAEVEQGASDALSGTTDREVQKRIESTLDSLRKRGAYREAHIVEPGWQSRLDGVSSKFPNFEPVIEHLRGYCALSELERRLTPIPPILLNGPPGIGKSLFADVIAEFLGTTCVRIGFDTAQANSSIVGSSDYWSNTQPGQIFQALVNGLHVNPVILVEEVDKVASHHYDPTNALLSLLEQTTAKHFRDLSYPWIEIDASLITWICTSNDADSLPPPLQSRLVRFDIDLPTNEQAEAIVLAIFAEVSLALPIASERIRLAPEAVQALANVAPRTAKLRIQRAIALAVFNHREVIELVDVLETNIRHKRTMGFVSHKTKHESQPSGCTPCPSLT